MQRDIGLVLRFGVSQLGEDMNASVLDHSSGVSHADDRLSVLKGTGFSPYINPAIPAGL